MSDDQKKGNKVLTGCLFSFLGGIVTLFLLGIGFLILLKSLFDAQETLLKQDSTVKETLVEGSEADNDGVIAVIDVTGVIVSGRADNFSTSCDDVDNIVNYALGDSRIKALIVRVDSPGGEVTASDIIYNAINKAKDSNIPVIVKMDSMAASGGYYISCNADHIIANPTTLTGSIGVIISGVNLEEGMNKLGIKNQVFKSGEFKDMLSMTREMTMPEKDYVQSMVNESYLRFLTLVSKGRGIEVQKLMEAQAVDGRVISGEKALEIGLVDSLGYWDDAMDKACELAHLSKPLVIHYQRKESLTDLLYDLGMEAKAPKRLSVEIGNTSFPSIKAGVPYMLPSTHVTGSVVQE